MGPGSLEVEAIVLLKLELLRFVTKFLMGKRKSYLVENVRKEMQIIIFQRDDGLHEKCQGP